MSEVKRILEKAASLIREHGWIQKKFGSREEGYCLIGAVVAASEDKKKFYLVHHLLIDLVDTPLVWNDTEGRTQEEVLELLERAAREC